MLTNKSVNHLANLCDYLRTEKKDTVLAVPWDYRLPKIRIKTRQVAQLANSRILVKIDKWDVDSMYEYIY